MKATLVLHTKAAYGKGFVEIVIWRVPGPVPGSDHPYKFRLAYIVSGKRVVGYDNERDRGGHRHLGDREEPYAFTTPERLMADFMDDVERNRK